MLAAWVAWIARVETYMEHLERVLAVRTDPDLVLALQDSDEPMVSMDTLRPLAQANIAFMDGLMASASESALTAVPLLVQLVRDWSVHGERARNSTYAPVVEALVPRISHVAAPRILLPGSGTGRLAFMLGERLEGAQVVALDPDEPAQFAAAFMLTAGEMQFGADDDMDQREARPPAPTLPHVIYPSIHVSIHWARTAHRLAGVQVPDVPLRALKRVEETTNISFTVGGLEDFDGEGLEDFHAVATCFVLDVFADMRRSLRILRAMLQRHGGLWINLGPFAFPEPNEGHVPADGGAQRGATPLTAAQSLHLVRAAGFEVLEERLVEGCEYNALPAYLERTVRTCLFFVARPKAERQSDDGKLEL